MEPCECGMGPFAERTFRLQAQHFGHRMKLQSCSAGLGFYQKGVLQSCVRVVYTPFKDVSPRFNNRLPRCRRVGMVLVLVRTFERVNTRLPS